MIYTLRGKTRPNRVSFFMWSLAPMVAFAAQIQQGIGLLALATFTSGFIPLLIFIASFVDKRAVWKLTSFDLICGILSFAGLLLWIITREGNVAIFFAIAADLLAAIPTVKKSYFHPESEHWAGYLSGGLNGVIDY